MTRETGIGDEIALTATFLEDRGFRITAAGKSYISNAIAAGRPLTERQRVALAGAFLDYLSGVGNLPSIRANGKPRVLRDFPSLPQGADEAFRYADDQTLEYWRRGSVMVSSIERYRTIENPGARDAHEGRGFVSISHRDDEIALGLEGGFSNYVLCLTDRAPKSERRRMQNQFGGNLIHIRGLSEFARKIAAKLRAEGFRIADVHYSNQKIIAFTDCAASAMAATLRESSNLTEEQLKRVSLHHFPLLRSLGDAVTIFCKPRKFALEWERRIAFDMPSDVTTETNVVEGSDLLDHLSFVS